MHESFCECQVLANPWPDGNSMHVPCMYIEATMYSIAENPYVLKKSK